MNEIYVYHVVTEKPMILGQKIVFNEKHHNGVYNRVMTCKKILDGENPQSDLADFIKLDLNKWTSVTFRELALEQVRRKEYPFYPSRMSCLYTSRTLEDAKNWSEFFHQIGRKVYSIVKMKVVGRIFEGDACNCFDGTNSEEDNLKKSRHYWRNDYPTDKPIIETLVDGKITVIEIVHDFHQ